MLKPKQQSLTAISDGANVSEKNILVVTTKKNFNINESSGFEKVSIEKGASLSSAVFKYLGSKKNLLITVDTSFASNFQRLKSFTRQINSSSADIVFLLSDKAPEKFSVSAKYDFDTLKLANVVGYYQANQNLMNL
jgi:hypothetical protein